MNDPSGSALSHVSSKGTQRMVKGGGGINLGWPRNQETSFSGSEGTLSLADAVGVIAWPKPIEEA